MQTQWRVGPNGATGLDYNVLLNLMSRRHYSDERHDQVLRDVQQIELAALDIIRKSKPTKPA